MNIVAFRKVDRFFLREISSAFILLSIHVFSFSQGGRYWDQNLNSEAALLSGAVVAGESGIAAIYYNPATISQMTKSNLSLSANLFSLYFFRADNALGTDFPAERTQLSIYPRIITLTLNPRKRPDLTIELAYFTKTNEYMQVNKGTSEAGDIISLNPGNENYTGEYYLRSKFQDYYGGAGFGYKISDRLALGLSALISYKDDQFYNLIEANAFTSSQDGPGGQYLSDSRYHLKYNMYDVRFITKIGMHLKQDSWSVGANINLPSVKLFGNGTVFKEYGYSNIHKETGNPEGSNLFYTGRQKKCPAHFKDPLSLAAGVNYYSPTGRSILLVTTEYFFKLKQFKYIEAINDPGEEGYDFSPDDPSDWLTFETYHKPVFNTGVAFKQYVRSDLTLSGGFRTDFRYYDPENYPGFPDYNKTSNYTLNVYHFNTGAGYSFKRGSLILGMQFSFGQEKNQRQIVNLKDPVEYISDDIMALTGPLNNQVLVRYFDVSVYFGFLFNFMKE
jgi:hypothetical protein